jgi:hypothetical protein
LGHEWSLRLKPSTFFSARASLPLFAKVVNDVRHTDRGEAPMFDMRRRRGLFLKLARIRRPNDSAR